MTISQTEPAEIKGHCHCGAVEFVVHKPPNWLVSCNCSICRRYATLWAHLGLNQATINCQPEDTETYIQGDRTLAIHRCSHCGCITHWLSLDPELHQRMAVNFRMCSDTDIAKFSIRQFDGADTWQFLD